MGTVVTDLGVEPEADVDSVSAEHLFNSSSWQARLDQARVTREKILAERALNGDGRLDNMSGPRPWEKTVKKPSAPDAATVQPEDLAERRRLRALALADVEMAAPMVEPVFRTSGAVHPKPVIAVPPAPPLAEAPVILPRQFAGVGGRTALIGVAFAFGLGIGLGAVLIPSLIAEPSAPPAPEAALTAPAVPAAATADVGNGRATGTLDPGTPIIDLSAVMPRGRPSAPEGMAALPQTPGHIEAVGVAPLIPAGMAAPVRVAGLARIAPAEPADAVAGFARDGAARPVVLTVLTSPAAGGAVPTAIAYPSAGSGLAPATDATAMLALPRDEAGDALPGMVSIAPAAAPPVIPFAGVTVRILAPQGTSDAEVTRLSGQVTQAGFTPDAARPTAFKVSQTHIRFYHAEDAEAAAVIAASLDAVARDFTGADAPPPPGMIELWVSGKPAMAEAAPAKKKAAKTKKTTRKVAAAQQPSGQSKLQALRDRLAAKMKNGDHL
jgi:hypothetical protein